MMFALWFLVYWGTIFFGSVLMKFYKIYWQSGRFTIRSKLIFVCKKLIILILLGSLVLGGIGFAIMKFGGEGAKETVQASVLILSNIYGMMVLVLLLAHGLIKMPIYLWKYSDNSYNLINSLSRADRVRKSYRTALIEYHEQISICKSLED